MAVLFDTQAYHRTLTDAGVPPGQADAHMRALATALEGGVATKQDIATVRQDLQALEHKLEVGLRDVKTWTGGVAAAMAGLIVGALKLL